MKKVITFGEPLDQTTAFMAGSKQFAFPFSVVDSDLIGTPEEQPFRRDEGKIAADETWQENVRSFLPRTKPTNAGQKTFGRNKTKNRGRQSRA
jgi:hypothetical protein